MNALILLPSLSRPQNIRTLASCPYMQDAPITLRLNPTDPALSEYLAIQLPKAWTHYIGAELFGACAIFREAFSNWPQESTYGFLGDDCIPLTPGWWEILTDAADLYNLSYCDDGHWGREGTTHPFLGGHFVRSVGQWAPDFLFHSFWDAYWRHIAEAIGCLEWCPSVQLHHKHPAFKAGPQDSTYQLAAARYMEDHDAFLKWRQGTQDE